MRIYLTIMLLLFCNTLGKADNPDDIFEYIVQNNLLQLPEELEYDTICNVNDYSVRIIKEQGKISRIGLNLFNAEIKKSVDRNLLCFVEEALLAKVINFKSDLYNRLVITNGSLADFKLLSPVSDLSINVLNSKNMTIEWTLNDKHISVTLPCNYDTSYSGTRSDIEDAFIAKLRSFRGNRIPFEPIDTLKLEPYGEDKLIYAGNSYQSKLITRHIYLNSEDLSPVCDTSSPIESIANLFIFPSEISDSIKVELKILKHEYGEKEDVVVPLSRFLAACEDDGCVAYWGTEKYENGVLEGTLFLYNHITGYDHVIKIDCSPEDILINKKGKLQARASLFIPTNNVQDLYSPYIEKPESKRIKYNE